MDDKVSNFNLDIISIDHIAIAVVNLEESIIYYRDVLGFKLSERRETNGSKTGMISAVMSSNSASIVLVQGTEPESQVSQFIKHNGPGVQHIALAVNNLEKTSTTLKGRGLNYATSLIESSNLKQIFTKRDNGSGVMIEFIQRGAFNGFDADNVQSLFSQLEESGEH